MALQMHTRAKNLFTISARLESCKSLALRTPMTRITAVNNEHSPYISLTSSESEIPCSVYNMHVQFEVQLISFDASNCQIF